MVQHITQELCINKQIIKLSLKGKREMIESYLRSYQDDISRVYAKLSKNLYISDDQIAGLAIKNIQLF